MVAAIQIASPEKILFPAGEHCSTRSTAPVGAAVRVRGGGESSLIAVADAADLGALVQMDAVSQLEAAAWTGWC